MVRVKESQYEIHPNVENKVELTRTETKLKNFGSRRNE